MTTDEYQSKRNRKSYCHQELCHQIKIGKLGNEEHKMGNKD